MLEARNLRKIPGNRSYSYRKLVFIEIFIVQAQSEIWEIRYPWIITNEAPELGARFAKMRYELELLGRLQDQRT